jgi:hypothetical protein
MSGIEDERSCGDSWVSLRSSTRVAGSTMFEYIRDPQEMQRRATAVIHGNQQGWLRRSSTRNLALAQASVTHRAIETRGT